MAFTVLWTFQSIFTEYNASRIEICRRSEEYAIRKVSRTTIDSNSLMKWRNAVSEIKIAKYFRLFFAVMSVMVLSFSAYFITNVWNKWNESPLVVTLSAISTSIKDIPFPGDTHRDSSMLWKQNDIDWSIYLFSLKRSPSVT